MTGIQFLSRDQFLDWLAQLEEAERIGDVRPALTNRLGNFLLTITKFFGEPLIRACFLNGIKISPLDILDDCKLECIAIVNLDDNNRNIVKAGALGRPPPPFARNDFKVVMTGRAHNERLNDPAVSDRLSKLIKLGF